MGVVATGGSRGGLALIWSDVRPRDPPVATTPRSRTLRSPWLERMFALQF